MSGREIGNFGFKQKTIDFWNFHGMFTRHDRVKQILISFLAFLFFYTYLK